ncbi:ATP-binding protein [Sanguibacter sp. HDW7]|uniref:ATP-binding protein n=1 Tax=Sanguibacter sp. HDW7 TaxID=2714931 RepID=UPI00140C20E1|nr:ATP-binding protein [Sanguibacter sp. HDW7]QIK82375.1 GHKL domain-containing protein [Sanguibacter sp. HDW7]
MIVDLATGLGLGGVIDLAGPFIDDRLPDIPRVLTGIAEWLGCLVYVLLRPRRVRGARFVLLAGGGLGVLVGVQVLVGTWPRGMWPVGMATAVAAMYGFIFVATRVSVRDAGYFTARALVLAELVAAFHWQVHCFLFVPTGLPIAPMPVAFLVVTYAATFGIAFAAETRHFRSHRALDVTPGELASAVAIALATFFMSNISFLSANTPFSGRFGAEIFYIRTLVDLCGFVALYTQQGQRLQNRAKSEVRAIDEMLRRQHEHYLLSKRNIETVNRTYHDLKHQIEVIRAEGDAGRRAAYLDDLEASVAGYSAQVDTGNGVLDVILTTKRAECAERGIDLTAVVDGQALDFMSAMDLAAIFGNALNNAVDGVLAVADPEKRLIKVAVYARDGLALVSVENWFTGELRTENGDIVTRRQDRNRHGFGLKSIRRSAEKYGGSMTVNVEDQWFVLRVLVPLPDAAR